MTECSCPIRPNMTWDELMNEVVRTGKNCCEHFNHPYLCPTLDKELRRADTERTRSKYYNKRLKQQGLTDEQIAQKKPRHRRRGNVTYGVVELELT